MPEIVFLPDHVSVKVSAGTSIQEAGRSAGLLLDAPCGGHGLCGKCKVRVGKQEVLACQYQVEEDVDRYSGRKHQRVLGSLQMEWSQGLQYFR